MSDGGDRGEHYTVGDALIFLIACLILTPAGWVLFFVLATSLGK